MPRPVALVAIVVAVMSCSTPASPAKSSDVGPTSGRTACGASTDCASYPQTPDDNEGQPFCCFDVSEQPACFTGNLGTCESGVPMYCDEAADCAPGLHCCDLGDSRALFACTASCKGLIQLCKTDAECENGKACTPYICSRDQPLASCGPLAFDPGFGSSFGCVPAPTSSQGGGSMFTPATPVADPCALLALPDVQALVPGAPDGAPLPPEDDPDIWARGCAWQSGGKALTLLVEGARNSKGQVVLNSAVELTSTSTRQATAVSGLGDKAVYLVNQGLGQILNALKGATIVSASVSGFTPEVPESSLEPLVAEALGKL